VVELLHRVASAKAGFAPTVTRLAVSRTRRSARSRLLRLALGTVVIFTTIPFPGGSYTSQTRLEAQKISRKPDWGAPDQKIQTTMEIIKSFTVSKLKAALFLRRLRCLFSAEP
jgi:hypothetical protein